MAMRFTIWRIDFLIRFAQELPFAWECVTFESWDRAITCLLRQLDRQCGLEDGAVVFKAHLQARHDALGALYPTIADVLGIACAQYLPDPLMAQVRALRAIGWSGDRSELFRGTDSPMMKLRRRHTHEGARWPTGLLDFFANHPVTSLIEDLIYLDRDGPYRVSVLNLPVVLAIDVASGDSAYWRTPDSVELVRTHRVFDPEWFDEAYRMTIARCLARGVIEP